MRTSMENLSHPKVVAISDTPHDSLQAAVNQFLLWEMRSRDCIKVKRCYIDVAQDLEAGVLLSQIIYWHLPDKEGEQKLTVQRDGHWWLAKAREDWWSECRLTPKQFDRAIRHLESKELVCTKVYKWQGQNTKHLRVNWPGLLQALSLLDSQPEKVVGFRRREPVSQNTKAVNLVHEPSRDELTNNQSSRFPISQLSESPNSKSSGCPISQSLNYQIGKLEIPNQGSSELTNREVPIYKETEITSRDYNTYPPYPPQEAKQPSECVKPQDVEKSFEVEPPDSHACEAQTLAKTFCLEQANPAGDHCSAARREDQNRYQRNQSEYPKNLDGSDRLPWDTAKRGVFDPEFEKHMARSLMQYPVYQNLMFGELVTKVRKHISAGRYDLKRRDELLIEWEAMQSGHTANDFSSSTSSLTAKAAARRAKIARALSMEGSQ